MRVQLLNEHTFQLAGGGSIALISGSIVGANPGDYPINQLLGGTIQVTTAMVALDGAATTAINTEITRTQNASSGKPGSKPTRGATVPASSVKAWESV